MRHSASSSSSLAGQSFEPSFTDSVKRGEEEKEKKEKKQKKETKEKRPKWIEFGLRWRGIMAGQRSDVTVTEEQLFILLGRLTHQMEDKGEQLAGAILNERRAAVLFEDGDISEIILLSFQLLTDRLTSPVFLSIRENLLKDISIFFQLTFSIISQMQLSEMRIDNDPHLEASVCRKVRSHPLLRGHWAVYYGTALDPKTYREETEGQEARDDHLFSLWKAAFDILLPEDLLSTPTDPNVSPTSSFSYNSAIRLLARLLLKKSRVGLAMTITKLCANLMSTFENKETIDLVFYHLLIALKEKLPPMSRMIAGKISEAVWGPRPPTPPLSVVSGMDLMASRQAWPHPSDTPPSPSPSGSLPEGEKEEDGSIKRVRSDGMMTSGVLLDSDLYFSFEDDEEQKEQPPFLQKIEAEALNALIVCFLQNVCGSYSAAAFLRASPNILPQEIEKELRKVDVLIHSSTGQRPNIGLLLPILHLALLNIEKGDSTLFQESLSSHPLFQNKDSNPTESQQPNKEGSEEKDEQKEEKEEKERGPATAADAADEEIQRKLRVNFVENFFKNPASTDPFLAGRLGTWQVVGLFQGLKRLREWLHRFPFLLKTIFLIVLKTILDGIFPELSSIPSLNSSFLSPSPSPSPSPSQPSSGLSSPLMMG